jgi:hypothetical protein
MAFNIQPQQENLWCWAAVAVSLEHYFVPTSTLTQCQMASQVLQIPGCCGDHGPCDVASRLEPALEVVSNRTASGLMPLTFPTPGPNLSFAALKAEIDAFLPVCVRIEWESGNGHFVVVKGYRASLSGILVEVADPFYGYSTAEFTEFSTAYLDSGTWTDTYPVRV